MNSTTRRLMLTAVAMLLGIVAMLTACTNSSAPVSRLARINTTIDGQRVLALYRAGTPVNGVVIYFHGLDRDETVIESDGAHRELTTAFADAGYPVAASSASGNAYGNSASQADYAALIAAAKSNFKTDRVLFVAESMGAVAAVNLMAQDRNHTIRGLAGINPLLNLNVGPAQYLAVAHQVNPQYVRTSPVDLPVESLRGRDFRFYLADRDQLVLTPTNADLFSSRFGGVANISTVECTGEHLDASCIQGKDILRWFSGLDPR